MSTVTIQPGTDEDVANTVAVMGGEDWKMWIDEMMKAGVLADHAVTVAYSYIGPAVTEAVYRKGTIGKAKDDLEATAFTITDDMKDINGKAYVSVNKALVTQASSAIPVIPLYISLLYKTMKEKKTSTKAVLNRSNVYMQTASTPESRYPLTLVAGSGSMIGKCAMMYRKK